MSRKSQNKAFERLKSKADNNPPKVKKQITWDKKTENLVDEWLRLRDTSEDELVEKFESGGEYGKPVKTKEMIATQEKMKHANVILAYVDTATQESPMMFSRDALKRIEEDWENDLIDNNNTIIDEKNDIIGKIERIFFDGKKLIATVYYNYLETKQKIDWGENEVSCSMRCVFKKGEAIDAVIRQLKVSPKTQQDPWRWRAIYSLTPTYDDKNYSLQECKIMLE